MVWVKFLPAGDDLRQRIVGRICRYNLRVTLKELDLYAFLSTVWLLQICFA